MVILVICGYFYYQTIKQQNLEKNKNDIDNHIAINNPCVWNPDLTDNENEENIMDYFKPILSGTESNKSKLNVLYQVNKTFKENNIYYRLKDAKFRKAATTFGKLSHCLDLSYPPKSQLTTIDPSTNIQLIKDIKYCIRHAVVAYKKRKLATQTKEKVAFKSTKTLLRDYFDIPIKDIIIDNSKRNRNSFINKLHAPRYYLCIDRKNKRIILSVRGTASYADRITDINGYLKRYKVFDIDGFAHEGILASARYIADNVTVEIVKQCQLFTDYQVIITGHSLGGGVASLLGLMYYNHPIIYKQNKLKVFAFAPPCILSKEFNQGMNDAIEYIYNIILETDFITRASIQSVIQHNLRCDAILEADDDLIDKCLKNLEDIKDDEDEKRKFCEMLKGIDPPNIDEKLFQFGRILWYVPNAVLEDDVAVRRKCLMCLNDNDNDDGDEKKAENEGDEEVEIDFDLVLSKMKQNDEENENRDDKVKDNKFGWSKMMERRKDEKVKRKEERRRMYGADNYTLCEATNCRHIFQEFVVDYPQSLYTHMPQRYLWAIGETITE